jgi:pyrimidine-nucleoside phosphorylase
MAPDPRDHFVTAKRAGEEHTEAELRALVRGIADGSMDDGRLADWLRAAATNGLTDDETVNLTLAMRDVGTWIPRGTLLSPRADKHSTGGVGDKVTLVAAPLAAACGVPVLKLTGRALGFSGGTADKLEAVPGVRTDLGLDQAKSQVEAIGIAIAVQSGDVAPADRRMYAMRDRTDTIACVPLIASSIMSKKLAGGADALVLDVKVGRGTFMGSLADARRLAALMVRIGRLDGVRVEALLTDMDRPLGRAVGNLPEVAEAYAMLTAPRQADARLTEVSLAVAARMVALAAGLDPSAALARVKLALEDGSGAGKLEELLRRQGARDGALEAVLAARAAVERYVRAPRSGYVADIEPATLGRVARGLPGHSSGIVLRRAVGDAVSAGDRVAVVMADDAAAADAAAELVYAAFAYASDPPVTNSPLLGEAGAEAA